MPDIDLTGDEPCTAGRKRARDDAAANGSGTKPKTQSRAPGMSSRDRSGSAQEKCCNCARLISCPDGGAWCPANDHFTCLGCLNVLTLQQSVLDESASDPATASDDPGRVWCPHKQRARGCSSREPFSHQALARQVEEATFEAYLDALRRRRVAQRGGDQRAGRKAQAQHQHALGAAAPEAQPGTVLCNGVRVPDTWDLTVDTDKAHFVAVPNGSQEWQDVVKRSAPYSDQVAKVQRVQNVPLWDAFSAQLGVLKRKYDAGLRNGGLRVDATAPGTGPTIVQSLWHGSRSTPTCQLGCWSISFCSSYSGTANMWGSGTYFATELSYSYNGFAFQPAVGNRQIVLADVLTGAPGRAQGMLDKRPPKLDESHDWHRHLAYPGIFHQCESTTPDGLMYIVFGQNYVFAYPRYIVVFNPDRLPPSRGVAPIFSNPAAIMMQQLVAGPQCFETDEEMAEYRAW